jgi:hypothetical protein
MLKGSRLHLVESGNLPQAAFLEGDAHLFDCSDNSDIRSRIMPQTIVRRAGILHHK